MKTRLPLTLLSAILLSAVSFAQDITDLVNPFLGTATLWEKEDLGYERHRKTRTWGAEVFPGASLPNAMIQASPVTMYRSGAGYQYEDSTICGFSHTNKGHWNLLHFPVLPVTGNIDPVDFASHFSHENESAHPGYYQVYLDRYGVNAELTATPRCAYHRYTFRPGDEKKLLADMTRNNNRVTEWAIRKEGPYSFSGYQNGEGKIYFYAVSNYGIDNIGQIAGQKGKNSHTVSIVSFKDSKGAEPLELKIGFSFVSIENARMNLETEMQGKDFTTVREEADSTWNSLLSRIQVSGGTERQKRIFYSCLYRAFLWPCLRSDVNGEYTDVTGNVTKADFNYYTLPSFWDDYRNKLILLGMLEPQVAADVASSVTDMGEKGSGYMPTFFHGDHASAFIAGTWLRGIHGFDLERAYRLLLRNATVPGPGGRRYMDEYLAQGWIAEKDTTDVPFYDEYKGAVTKTLEYSYDDYATALIAKVLGDRENYRLLMDHSQNYKNVFDPSTGFYRGRTADGNWIEQFDPYYPYFQYMYRESNAWNNLFYPPHDIKGVLGLYPDKKTVENKLDSLFTEPWRGYEVENLTAFIGNYCHGNQPGHSIPYMYYFVGKQPKAQAILNTIMDRFYDMGAERLALAGMDDAGEMTSWYVLNAIGLYTYSPADPEYIVTVPLFDEVKFTLGNGKTFTIKKTGNGEEITGLECGGRRLKGWFVRHEDIAEGKTLQIDTK